jgi:cell division protein FtsL
MMKTHNLSQNEDEEDSTAGIIALVVLLVIIAISVIAAVMLYCRHNSRRLDDLRAEIVVERSRIRKEESRTPVAEDDETNNLL